MAEVIWTKRAFQQFERAVKYIAEEHGRQYAETVRQRIISDTSLLEKNTGLGFPEPLLEHKKFEYKSLVVWSYKVIYRIEKGNVIISRVFHMSRNPKKLRGI